MEKKLFGTDGIRGRANQYPITPEVAMKLGKALAFVLQKEQSRRVKVIIGKDTRLSGYMLETAMISGLVSAGAKVYQVGPVPTPAVAHLVRSFAADAGIMITASHNPADDNGIKIFDRHGFKLADAQEAAIEDILLNDESPTIASEEIGKARRIEDARGRYIEFAKSAIGNHSLHGLKVVLDCANGAAYGIAPGIFKELGAEVIATGITPDGRNINHQCGATYPRHISELVKTHRADLGIAFDGDADRVLFCDHYGEVINGDRLIGLCALALKKKGQLRNNRVVLTVMSNLGLIKAMEKEEIEVITTQVGDRYVIEAMRQYDANLGGEQSGHLIFLDYAPTGDGIISSLHILSHLMDSGKLIHELTGFMTEYPQILKNLAVDQKIPFKDLTQLPAMISECEQDLGQEGRVLVRYSGTENKLRLMVEARDGDKAKYWNERLTLCARKELNHGN